MRIRPPFPLLSLALPLLALPARGATLCVNQGGAPGCKTTIAAAVAAASAGDVINVGSGTYTETVTINIPLSLAGSGATIDATGLTRGFFVDGLTNPGLNAVHISGFTVRNAQLEGILVLNASAVTVDANTVTNNNLALVGGNCTALPTFEPGEAGDCGEGIHLQAADHSIVTNNTVTGNSGGILLSDDTGANHDNLVSFNTSRDNSYACGIVLASHVQAVQSSSLTPLGVYHNTVYGNRSIHNGYSAGGGAGIGLFASVPGAKSYGNVVVDNLVMDNGHPGISVHSHAPSQDVNDNLILGNTVINNGADTADAATPGPTGINVYSLMPATGIIVTGNAIQNETVDVATSVPAVVEVHYNGLYGSLGVLNLGAGTVDAAENWWGCLGGPTFVGSCSLATGPGITSVPYLQTSINPQPNY